MRCWQFGLFLLFSLVSLDVWAQDLPDIERLLEGNDILNTEDGYEEMVDILSNLLMTPVNVNMAGFDSLKMLFLLSDSQIDQLLEFRKKYGNFLHIREYVDFRKGNASRTLYLNAVTRRHYVKAADSSRSAGSGSVFIAGLSKLLRLIAEKLTSKRTFADTG